MSFRDRLCFAARDFPRHLFFIDDDEGVWIFATAYPLVSVYEYGAGYI